MNKQQLIDFLTWYRSKTGPLYYYSVDFVVDQYLADQQQEYDLKLCDKCFQMTNHLDGVCQKCKSTDQQQVKRSCNGCYYMTKSHTIATCADCKDYRNWKPLNELKP